LLFHFSPQVVVIPPPLMPFFTSPLSLQLQVSSSTDSSGRTLRWISQADGFCAPSLSPNSASAQRFPYNPCIYHGPPCVLPSETIRNDGLSCLGIFSFLKFLSSIAPANFKHWRLFKRLVTTSGWVLFESGLFFRDYSNCSPTLWSPLARVSDVLRSDSFTKQIQDRCSSSFPHYSSLYMLF